jgi:dTDP-4-amino-4,6-dideoxygalactose transaminase
MLHNPFRVVEMFEESIADYAGAPYAVACDSCTNAIFLSCRFKNVSEVTIPCQTYVSVPQSIIHAGGKVKFEERDWSGIYQLKPYDIYDSAKRLTSGMYIPGSLMCLSFHIKKPLPIGKGGMILTDDKEAVSYLKKARYEGRSPIDYRKDDIEICGWNMYMTPEEAARGLTLLMNHPENFSDQSEIPPYRDLRTFRCFNE